MPTSNSRRPDLPIDPIFLERLSPPAFTGEPMEEADLMTIVEAARWTPSSTNSQRRRSSMRGETPAWHRCPHLLTPSNQS